MRAWVPCLGAAALLGAACSFAWDDFDPRSSEGADATGMPAAGSAGHGASGGGDPTMSTSNAGGQGGAPGVGGMSSGGSGGAGGARPTFLDDFNRTDDLTIGNGWIEKTPLAFDLEMDSILRNSGGIGYRDNLVYRPPSETLLDVEVTVEFEYTIGAINSGPQLFLRAQSSIATADEYDAYNLWFPGAGDTAQLGRQHGSTTTVSLDAFTISPALSMGNRYRLRLRAEGQNPVMLEAYVESWNGSAWIVAGSGSFADGDSTRIDTAGTMGFAGNTTTNYFLDNFGYGAL